MGVPRAKVTVAGGAPRSSKRKETANWDTIVGLHFVHPENHIPSSSIQHLQFDFLFQLHSEYQSNNSKVDPKYPLGFKVRLFNLLKPSVS